MKNSYLGLGIFMVAVFVVSINARADLGTTDQLLSQAEDAYEDAFDLYEETTDYRAVCFKAHQAIEKAMKAALKDMGQQPGSTHTLTHLANRMMPTYPELRPYMTTFRDLDKAYNAYKFPSTSTIEFVRQDARDCLQMAEDFYNFTEENM